MIGSGKVAVIPDIGGKVASKDFTNIKSTEIASGFAWPNDVQPVPANVFGEGVNAI